MLQSHVQVLHSLTTAHLAQTMTLLSLTADELHQQIEAELASNPALELVEERRCPTCRRLLPQRGSCPVCSRPNEANMGEAIVFVSPPSEFGDAFTSTEKQEREDELLAFEEDLSAFVLRQVSSDISQEDRRIAAYLLTNLDEDGFLDVSLFEIARYFHVPVERVKKVQSILQHAEPYGVASSSLQEALSVQVEILSETCAVPEVARRIIDQALDLFMHRKIADIARKLDVYQSEVESAIRFIGENLNPYPARSHWGGNGAGRTGSNLSSHLAYHQADIIISHLNNDLSNPLSVEILLPLKGTLQVNPLFRSALQEASAERREEWRADLERASLFVKCLQQRNHTMVRLMQRVVAIQREFILRGEKYHTPYTRFRVAQELGVHESTISRAVANKAVQLPNRRIIPLSSFFDRSLNARTIIKEMVANEATPLSDTELAGKLADQGIVVARRTVAKYRAMEGILPAHLRQTSNQRAMIAGGLE